MKYRYATPQELAEWDSLILTNPDGGHILQTKAWGEAKSRHGWQAEYLVFELGKTKIYSLVFMRNVPYFGALWYITKGPGVASARQLSSIGKLILDSKQPPFVLKCDPELLEDEAPEASLKPLVKAPYDFQISKATIVVDLAPSEEEIIASFKQKTRYNIRLSERKGVTVEPVKMTRENMRLMYDMLSATEKRGGFFLRPKDYFFDYWRLQSEAGQGQLFFASYQGEVLAGIFTTHLGSKGWYKDGGSFDTKRELMAPYLLQWEVMKWLKAQGVISYDMVGVPPRKLNKEGHSMYGLYRFKSGFNPEITEFIGVYDLASRPNYRLWTKFGDRLLGAYYRRMQRNLLY